MVIVNPMVYILFLNAIVGATRSGGGIADGIANAGCFVGVRTFPPHLITKRMAMIAKSRKYFFIVIENAKNSQSLYNYQ